MNYKRLADCREDADLTQAQVAELLNVRREVYNRYETGKYEIPLSMFITLAKHYNVSLDYLAGLIDTPRTLDGKPYLVTKKMTIKNIRINNNSGKINIKN